MLDKETKRLRIKEYSKRYYQKNKEKNKEKDRLRSKKYREKIYSDSILREEYRKKRRELTREYYKNGRSKELKQKRQQRNKDYVNSYFKTHPCSICGETITVCLNFHHIKDKKDTISGMVSKGHSIERIEKEIQKCIVLCRNCHNKIHANERDQIKIDITATGRNIQKVRARKRKQEYMANYKKDHPCSCGESDPRCLVFHHENPKDKEYKMAGLCNGSWDNIKSEIKKCTVMCANCHMLFHYVSG